MSEITVSAKTVDDAITEALIQLGVTSDQIEYDVIEKGSPGFFGIGSKQAVIKVRKKVEAPVIEKEPEIRKPEVKKTEVRREQSFNRKTENTAKPAEKANTFSRREHRTGVVKEETIRECEKFLQDVLAAMGMEVEMTSCVDSEGALNINMEGEHMGVLIGKRGQTLDSLQYLTNRIANKSQEDYVRVKLDTENYRQRRKETLENLAKNIAYKVKRTKRPVSLEPMNPYERRVIHSALQGDKYVSTHSEGEEPYRRVVVTLIRK